MKGEKVSYQNNSLNCGFNHFVAGQNPEMTKNEMTILITFAQAGAIPQVSDFFFRFVHNSHLNLHSDVA